MSIGVSLQNGMNELSMQVIPFDFSDALSFLLRLSLALLFCFALHWLMHRFNEPKR